MRILVIIVLVFFVMRPSISEASLGGCGSVATVSSVLEVLSLIPSAFSTARFVDGVKIKLGKVRFKCYGSDFLGSLTSSLEEICEVLDVFDAASLVSASASSNLSVRGINSGLLSIQGRLSQINSIMRSSDLSGAAVASLINNEISSINQSLGVVSQALPAIGGSTVRLGKVKNITDCSSF